MIVPARPAPAGTVSPIWTDPTGNLTGPPATAGDARLQGVRAGLTALLVFGGVVASCWMLVRRAANRRRQAAWQGEWTLIEPRWTNRR
jgi:hypothetical protein